MSSLPYRTLAIAALAALSLAIVSCSSDDNNTVTPPQEFKADSTSFVGYTSWTQSAGPFHGADPAGILSGAHASGDTSVTRIVYLNNKDAARGSDGQFPVGTIFAKAMVMSDGSTAAVTAMVKRGGSFNTNGNGWEYFLISGGGSILFQGDATLNNIPCKGCHSTNADKDYIFTM